MEVNSRFRVARAEVNIGRVVRILGLVMLVLGAAQLTPIVVCLLADERQIPAAQCPRSM